MCADKLYRLEDLEWNPPVLSFVIERHGGTVKGSTRGKLQLWQVNLEKGIAQCNPNYSFRQLTPRDPALRVEPIAEEIAHLIKEKKENEKLKWNADRARVRVLV